MPYSLFERLFADVDSPAASSRWCRGFRGRFDHGPVGAPKIVGVIPVYYSKDCQPLIVPVPLTLAAPRAYHALPITGRSCLLHDRPNHLALPHP